MKEMLSQSQQLSINHRNPSFHLLSDNTISSTNNINQISFIHRFSLEILLNLIKNTQLQILSKESKKIEKEKAKQILKALNENLNLIFIKKKEKEKYIKNQIEISKKKMQILIYPSKMNENENENGNSKIYPLLLKKKQLQLINFQIINEIEKTKYLFEQKSQLYSCIKSFPYFFEVSQERLCNNNYEYFNKVDGFLTEKVKLVRLKFMELVKDNSEKESEINDILSKIKYIRANIDNYQLNGLKKYINTEDIIQEESKEYNNTINNTLFSNQSKRNSLSKIDIDNLIKNTKGITPSKNNKDRIITKNKLGKNNILNNIKKNEGIITDKNKKNINNYFNMNINLNFHLNNNYSNDRKIINVEVKKNERNEMNLKEKDKNIIPTITESDNNNETLSISDSSSENDDDNYILEINQK